MNILPLIICIAFHFKARGLKKGLVSSKIKFYLQSEMLSQLVLKNELLVRKQLCTRNKVFNRLEALYRKSSLSIAFKNKSL